jgi:hypothetical protein
VSDNQHFDRAKSRLHNGTTNEVARAQAEATLALAHEQRTANLIALRSKPQVTMQDINGNPTTHSINTDKVGELLHEILERLGAA